MFGSTENGLYFVFIYRFLWAAPPKNLFGFVFCSQYLKCGYENKIWEQLFTFLDSGKWVPLHIFQKLNSSRPTNKFFSFFRDTNRRYISQTLTLTSSSLSIQPFVAAYNQNPSSKHSIVWDFLSPLGDDFWVRLADFGSLLGYYFCGCLQRNCWWWWWVCGWVIILWF